MERVRATRRRGFTLIEVMLVVLILATLVAVAAVALWPQAQEADKQTTKIKIGKVMQGLDLYRLKLKEYPSQEQGLGALLTKPTFEDTSKDSLWAGPYAVMSQEDLKDAWRHDLTYKLEDVDTGSGSTEKKARVYSWGPNGQDENGDGDDIKDDRWAADTAATNK